MFKLMLSRSSSSRLALMPALLAATCFLLGSSSGAGAPQPPQTPAAGAAAPAADSGDQQVILIAEHRTATAATKRDDLNSLVKEALNTVFSQSGTFKAITFSPYMPALSRAVLTHTLEVTDLEEPLTPESLSTTIQTSCTWTVW